MGYIYLVTNTINGKKYVGQTQQDDIKHRWNKHKQIPKHSIGAYLRNAYIKYGIDKFKFQIICICFNEDCNRFEEEYIKKYNTYYPNGYNLTLGGGNSKHHPDTIERIRIAKSGENAYNYGKHISEEQKKKTKETWKKKKEQGFIQGSEESRERFAQVRHLGVLASIKPVAQYDFHGTLIKRFNSSSDACKETGFCKCNIQKACAKEIKYKGYIWKYLPKESPPT